MASALEVLSKASTVSKQGSTFRSDRQFVLPLLDKPSAESGSRADKKKQRADIVIKNIRVVNSGSGEQSAGYTFSFDVAGVGKGSRNPIKLEYESVSQSSGQSTIFHRKSVSEVKQEGDCDLERSEVFRPLHEQFQDTVNKVDCVECSSKKE